MSIKTIFAAALTVCLPLLVSPAKAAGTAALTPTAEAAVSPRAEKFFKQEQFGFAVMSPDHKSLAVTTALEGRMRLAVVDIATRKVTPLAGFTDADVCTATWINNDRLVFQLADRESEDRVSCLDGMFAVNRDGSKLVELASTDRKQNNLIDMGAELGSFIPVWNRYELIGVYGNGSPDILIVEHQWKWGGGHDAGIFRINTITARKNEFATHLVGLPTDFYADNHQRLRIVATRGNNGLTNLLWYRDDISSSWRKIAEVNALQPEFEIVGFDEDDKTLYVNSHNGGDKRGLYKFDFANNAVGEKVIGDPEIDIGGNCDLGYPYIFSTDTHKLLGVRVESEPPHTFWLDKTFAAAQEVVDSAFPDRVNMLSGDPTSQILVRSYSSTAPDEFYLYDPTRKKLEFLFNSMPWIKAADMSEKLVFDYKARDGMSIPSYLTIPKGKPMKALPLVVYPHPGPFIRDSWDFDSVVQFLADQGYAVLQPQHRGSNGYGWDHYAKGLQQWGMAMEDDIADGVKDLIKQGVVDPKRVCIMGLGNGGYATLMGLEKNPDLYRCGVEMLGITDLNLFFSDQSKHDNDAARFWEFYMGSPTKMPEYFNANSPALHADKIKAPLFMVYNKQDGYASLSYGERMRDALKKNGKTFEWMQFDDEQHSFVKEANRYKLFTAIEKFLKTYNPAD